MIATWRPKPRPRNGEDQIAAKWPGPNSLLNELIALARMADPEASLSTVYVWTSDGAPPILLVRYLRDRSEGPPEIGYVHVEPGQWLAYDPGAGHLYSATDADWAQWYDPVPGKAQPSSEGPW